MREERPDERAVGPNRPLTFDEGVALLVAFLSLGSVLLWGLTRGGVSLLGDSLIKTDAATVVEPEQNRADGLFDFGFGAEDANTGEDVNAVAPGAVSVEKREVEQTDESQSVTDARRDLTEQARERDRPTRNIGEAMRTGVTGAAAGIAGTTTAPQNAPVAEKLPPAPADSADSSAIPLSAAATATPKDAVRFGDVPDNYWAKPYIDALSSRDLISGFEDGDFKPDQFVTRAQIANIVARTFDLTATKETLKFSDVAGDYWARESIDEVVKGGFMTGFPNKTFNPNAPVTRAQALTTLVTGLDLQPPTNAQVSLSRYTDAPKIPAWATEKVAAATAGNLVVNYPNLQQLNPDQPTTRAELSAMIYQALAKEGVVEPIASEYVVKP